MPITRLRPKPVFIFLVLATSASLNGRSLWAEVRPVRFDTVVPEPRSVDIADPLILDPYRQKLANSADLTETFESVPTTEIISRCGDGDGCLVGLFQFVHGEVIASLIVRRSLFTTGNGSQWRVFDSDQVLGSGDLADDSDETLLFTGGLVACALLEGDLIRGFGYFLMARQPGPPIGDDPIVDCLLRIDD